MDPLSRKIKELARQAAAKKDSESSTDDEESMASSPHGYCELHAKAFRGKVCPQCHTQSALKRVAQAKQPGGSGGGGQSGKGLTKPDETKAPLAVRQIGAEKTKEGMERTKSLAPVPLDRHGRPIDLEKYKSRDGVKVRLDGNYDDNPDPSDSGEGES